MKRIRILAVGRLKTPHWREASAFYLKRLSHGLLLEEHVVKDADAKLPLAERMEQEASRLLQHLRPGDTLISLDENGVLLTSRDFAKTLRGFFDRGTTPCFAVGGAYGLAPSLLSRSALSLSLGRMTFPHELARVLLLEQLYRAENITAGTGYHH